MSPYHYSQPTCDHVVIQSPLPPLCARKNPWKQTKAGGSWIISCFLHSGQSGSFAHGQPFWICFGSKSCFLCSNKFRCSMTYPVSYSLVSNPKPFGLMTNSVSLTYRTKPVTLPCDQSFVSYYHFFTFWSILFLYFVTNPVSLFFLSILFLYLVTNPVSLSCDQSCFVIFLSILFLYLVTNPISLLCDQSCFFILWSILFL